MQRLLLLALLAGLAPFTRSEPPGERLLSTLRQGELEKAPASDPALDGVFFLFTLNPATLNVLKAEYDSFPTSVTDRHIRIVVTYLLNNCRKKNASSCTLPTNYNRCTAFLAGSQHTLWTAAHCFPFGRPYAGPADLVLINQRETVVFNSQLAGKGRLEMPPGRSDDKVMSTVDDLARVQLPCAFPYKAYAFADKPHPATEPIYFYVETIDTPLKSWALSKEDLKRRSLLLKAPWDDSAEATYLKLEPDSLILNNYKLKEGASGGPIVDSLNRVVGLVSGGTTNNPEIHFAFAPSRRLREAAQGFEALPAGPRPACLP